MFWKQTLSEPEAQLLEAVLVAHGKSAFRDNPSSVAFQVAFHGSNSYPQALIAALATLGDKHGPIAQTYDLLTHIDPRLLAEQCLQYGMKIPGWGTSFKDDNTWDEVNGRLASHFPAAMKVLDDITLVLHTAGKMIGPNPSAYTASTAIVLGLPKELSPWLFVAGRLDAWSVLALKGEM